LGFELCLLSGLPLDDDEDDEEEDEDDEISESVCRAFFLRGEELSDDKLDELESTVSLSLLEMFVLVGVVVVGSFSVSVSGSISGSASFASMADFDLTTGADLSPALGLACIFVISVARLA